MGSTPGKSGRMSPCTAVYQGPRKRDFATFAQMGTANHARVNMLVKCLKSMCARLKHFLNSRSC
jgi:hypothetical protein